MENIYFHKKLRFIPRKKVLFIPRGHYASRYSGRKPRPVNRVEASVFLVLLHPPVSPARAATVYR
jgi:hypothetical protein